MVSPTLSDIREHIESLATDDGQYHVVCGRTSDQPVPAAGNRFPDRATARAAAWATEQYRSALRRYDPQVPYYDLIVCEVPTHGAAVGRSPASTDEPPQRGRCAPDRPDGTTLEHRTRIEFCHRVAGAVFETLSDTGHDDVQTAIMDAYFDLAETVGDPDDLCLCLLESMASELDERLAPASQTEVLANAAARLESLDNDGEPLDATLTALDRRGLIDGYTRWPWSIDLTGGTRSVVVLLSGYALAARDNRLPVLPLTLELCRHELKWPPQSVQVTTVDNGWRLRVVLADTDTKDGVVRAPIDGEV